METTYQRRDDLLEATVDAEVLLFDAARGTYFATAGVGALVWAELAAPRSLAELCAAVVAAYDVTAEVCEADLTEFLAALHAAGIVREA
jgi:hypothetical protein